MTKRLVNKKVEDEEKKLLDKENEIVNAFDEGDEQNITQDVHNVNDELDKVDLSFKEEHDEIKNRIQEKAEKISEDSIVAAKKEINEISESGEKLINEISSNPENAEEKIKKEINKVESVRNRFEGLSNSQITNSWNGMNFDF